jgi:hypothetical protein
MRVSSRVYNFDGVVTERRDEQTLMLRIEREMIDAARNVRKRNCRDLLQRLARRLCLRSRREQRGQQYHDSVA